MTETLTGLVSQYSPSGQEQRAAAWLVERMHALGYSRAFLDEAGNAVGVMGNGPREVVLLGHIDTVPGEIPVRVEGNILYGRGAVDAKGPLACFTDAAAGVGVVDGWQMVVIGAVEEERDSKGARYIAGQYRPDFAVIGEPNRWDRIALGYKGAASAQITVRREQSHTASGETTASEAAVAAWLAVKAYTETYNTGKERAFDRLLPTLLNMESGEDGFEQWARLTVRTRLPVQVDPQQWYFRLEEITAGGDAALQVQVNPQGYAIPAWACEKNTRLVRALLTGIRSQGGSPAFVYKTGTADLNIVAPAWNCPALVYGPGDSSLDHTPNEHILLDEYSQSVAVLVHALKTLTANSAAA